MSVYMTKDKAKRLLISHHSGRSIPAARPESEKLHLGHHTTKRKLGRDKRHYRLGLRLRVDLNGEVIQ